MLELRNYMEDFVLSGIGMHLKKLDVCQCDACRLDIAAIVLNELPTKYIVNHEGAIYTKLSLLAAQYEIDLIAATARAAEIVRKNPRHNPEDRI